MNIRQMEYFLAVAEAGNISAAAQKLKISQPPLSTQIRLLEEELGVRLMDRGARRIRLTDAGRLLYRRALSIVDMTESTTRELKELAGGLHGLLSLGTISSCGAVLLDERMPLYHQRYPHISFELWEGNTFELLEKLQRGGIELALVRTPFREDGLECIYLQQEPMVVAAKKEFFQDYPAKTVSLHDLARMPLIYYRRFEHLLNAAFQQLSLTPEAACKNDDARTCLMWARAGLGVALVPQSMVPMMDDGSLCSRVVDDSQLMTQVALVRRKGSYCSAPAKRFWQLFAGDPEWDKGPEGMEESMEDPQEESDHSTK